MHLQLRSADWSGVRAFGRLRGTSLDSTGRRSELSRSLGASMAVVKFFPGAADKQTGDSMPSRNNSFSARNRRVRAAHHTRRGGKFNAFTASPGDTRDQIITALQCSPVDLSFVTSLINRDPLVQDLLHLSSGVPGSVNTTLSLQIVSIGIEPLIRILTSLYPPCKSYPLTLERASQ